MNTKTRKVAVSLTLTVDPEAWDMAYGEFTPEDVRSYILNMVQGSAPVEEGGIVAVSVKGAVG